MICLQLDQNFLSKEHIEYFKEQLTEVIQLVKENPDNAIAVRGRTDKDSPVEEEPQVAAVNVANQGTTEAATVLQQAPPSVLAPSAPIGQPTAGSDAARGQQPKTSRDQANLDQAAQKLQAAKNAEAGQSGGKTSAGSPNVSISVGTEPSSDAEYYTPLGSPDESRRSSIAACSTPVSCCSDMFAYLYLFISSK